MDEAVGIDPHEDALGHLVDARAGADAIGLVFWSNSRRAVNVVQAREIVASLPPFVTSVALFVDPDVAQVQRVLDTLVGFFATTLTASSSIPPGQSLPSRVVLSPLTPRTSPCLHLLPPRRSIASTSAPT